MITKEMIEEAEAVKMAAIEKASQLRNEYAVQECPLKVGQIVDMCGYAHKGKRMIVDVIKKPRYSYYGAWKVRGRLILKSGAVGVAAAEFCQSDYEREQPK